MSASDQDSRVEQRQSDAAVEQPPSDWLGILSRLGPGLIVAGSIVGSGELIATTKTGADAGFWLLWLIIIGCVIKVFVQVEFGRYAISFRRTTMEALAEVPGPRFGGGNWIVWYWFLMFVASIAQLGGIVGGVGQALAISVPLTQEGRSFNDQLDRATRLEVKRAELARATELGLASETQAALAADISQLESQQTENPWAPRDDQYWATLIAIVTAWVLMFGHYRLIQTFATAMVACFTLLTVVNLGMLQSNVTWQVTATDWIRGLSFRLPPSSAGGNDALITALATFGIIGVGASELVTYPYWCLEKGYARFTGPRDDSDAWADRARGWLRVMRWDAWCSMVVYTFATVAFYLLGASILGRIGLNPEGNKLIRTLSVMYEPVFGPQAAVLFLFGAFAVLYSTYFVANASHARVFSDALRVLGFVAEGQDAHVRRVRWLSGLFPLLCLVIYLLYPRPTLLVLISGMMQAIMLPMLALAGVYFRYRRCDPRLRPGKAWDIFLWVSAIGMGIAGIWGLVSKLLSSWGS